MNNNLDVNNSLSVHKKIEQKLEYNSKLYPRLSCKINFYPEQIIFVQDDRQFGFQVDNSYKKRLEKFFSVMDGTNSIENLQQRFFPEQPEIIDSLIQNLDKQSFLDGVRQVEFYSGTDMLEELQNLSEDLLNTKFSNNLLEQCFTSKPNKLLPNIIYGFAIEYYYFLAHKSVAETALLNFQSSTKIRQLINKSYSQSYEQENLLIEALKTINIDREKLINIMPLPETMGLCNGLSYWANFEPLFYFTTLDILSSQTWKIFEQYLKTCESIKLESNFIEPIIKLVDRMLKIKLENTAYQIFQEIDHIDRETQNRFQSQTYLFIEMYHNFSNAICEAGAARSQNTILLQNFY